MRVVVIREFIDKHTQKFHPIGEKLTMTTERFAEISGKGQFVVDISDESIHQEEVADFETETTEETGQNEQPETKETPKGRRTRSKKSESEDK